MKSRVLLTVPLMTRVTRAEAAELRQRARSQQVTRSTFIRNAVLNALRNTPENAKVAA